MTRSNEFPWLREACSDCGSVRLDWTAASDVDAAEIRRFEGEQRDALVGMLAFIGREDGMLWICGDCGCLGAVSVGQLESADR